MRWIAVASAVLLATSAQPTSTGWSVASPDGRTEIRVTRRGDGALQFRVTRDGRPVLGDSPLGIRRDDAAFDARLTYRSSSETRAIDEEYSLPHGKQKQHHVRARERTLAFVNGGGVALEIVLHAQNDGVAFRYRFPGTEPGTRTVVGELTGFTVPRGSTAWMLPRQPVGKYAPAYEDLYQQVAAGTASALPDGWAFRRCSGQPAASGCCSPSRRSTRRIADRISPRARRMAHIGSRFPLRAKDATLARRIRSRGCRGRCRGAW